MSLPRYESYVGSGTDWLGETPAHWHLVPLWTLFRRTKRTGFEGEQLLSVYRDFGVVPKASRDDNNNKPSDDLSVYQLVEPGDLAINKMKAWQGAVAISGHRGIVSPAYFIYESTHCEDGRFLHYLLRSPRYITGYLSLSKGIRVNQWDLEPQYHSRMPVLLPPRDEQATIAAFLDRETAKIDALIAEPDVEDGIPIVKGGDVKEHRLKVELLNRTTIEIEAPYARARLNAMDLVYSIRGTIGDAEVVPADLEGANITQDVARISPAEGVQTRWLLHVMKSKPVFVQLEQRSLGAAVRGINIFELKRARIPVPPQAEREEIAAFLDVETTRLDSLKAEADRTIQLLKERRSALIAAAVTGQIDVRNA